MYRKHLLHSALRLPKAISCRAGLVAVCWCLCIGTLAAQVVPVTKLKEEAARAQAAGKDDLATSLYAQSLARDPTWSEGWWKYGALLYGKQRFQDADAAYTHLTRLAPQNPLGFAMLGMCEYELGDWNNASLHLNKALAHGGLPLDIANGAAYDFGLTLMRQKNRNGALIAFRLLQHYSPDYPNLVIALGSAELGMEQIPSPESASAKAASLAGQAAVAVLKLNSDDAERLYRQLVQEYPQLPFAHLCLALFLENLGRHAEAEKDLKIEADLNGTSPEAWIWLARLALARRDAEQTRMYAAHAITLSPNDGLPYLLSGRSYILDSQWAEALENLQKAEALTPDSYEVHNALVTVYGELHDPQGVASERRLFAQTYAVTHPAQPDGR